MLSHFLSPWPQSLTQWACVQGTSTREAPPTKTWGRVYPKSKREREGLNAGNFWIYTHYYISCQSDLGEQRGVLVGIPARSNPRNLNVYSMSCGWKTMLQLQNGLYLRFLRGQIRHILIWPSNFSFQWMWSIKTSFQRLIYWGLGFATEIV